MRPLPGASPILCKSNAVKQQQIHPLSLKNNNNNKHTHTHTQPKKQNKNKNKNKTKQSQKYHAGFTILPMYTNLPPDLPPCNMVPIACSLTQS